jgi:hypothetical protein
MVFADQSTPLKSSQSRSSPLDPASGHERGEATAGLQYGNRRLSSPIGRWSEKAFAQAVPAVAGTRVT